jgi:hypothetical protein
MCVRDLLALIRKELEAEPNLSQFSRIFIMRTLRPFTICSPLLNRGVRLSTSCRSRTVMASRKGARGTADANCVRLNTWSCSVRQPLTLTLPTANC